MNSGAIRPAHAAARAFYCDALGGRQIGRRAIGDANESLSFRVGGELVTTGPVVKRERRRLVVDDAVAIAARCWDAGFTVRVRGSAAATTIAVVDPFDLELELVSGS
jgi:hypothetical protein